MKPVGFIIKSEAALLLGCTVRTVDNLIKRGTITHYKMGRSVFFKRDDILSAIENYRVAAK